MGVRKNVLARQKNDGSDGRNGWKLTHPGPREAPRRKDGPGGLNITKSVQNMNRFYHLTTTKEWKFRSERAAS